MSSSKQWDISKALAIASAFHLFHNIGKFCAIPFLTIYFRHLGLSAPLVGVIIGVKHLVSVFWAPGSSFLVKTKRKRRVLIMMSLVLSAGAGLTFTFYPPADKDIVLRRCNDTHSWRNRLTTAGAMDLNGLEQKDIVFESPQTTPAVSTLQSIPSLPQNPTSPYVTGRENADTTGISTSVLNIHTEVDSSTEKALGGDRRNIHRVAARTTSSPHTLNKSAHKIKSRHANSDIPHQSYLFFEEHKTFLIVLGVLLLWEVFAAPVEWTADNNLYEYLDFVDATDRHGKLWIFCYMGACAGSSFITLVVDNLSCFFTANIRPFSLHFYGYSAFMIITLLISPWYPIHVSKKTEHANKTMKALSLIGNDGRVILMTITVFLIGAVGSTAQNFLFWKMQDVGSTELYMGLSITVALLSEIALYVFKTKLLKALTFRWTVAVSLICLAIQFLYYSFLWTSWAVLPIQLLSALSNGAMWWSVLSVVDDVATPGTERSLQMVLHCLSYGCGASIGSFASGFIIRSFSLAVLYQACAVALFLWALLFLVVQPRLPRVKKINYSRLLAADQSDMSDSDEDQDKDWLVEAMKEETKFRKW
ncbi:major facilitator superfamily domain-containing protein 6-like [Spea bombifrons]|uniref:major facilitator superfamily domain-containing protein 6-like n=1 Tax=Spea bombifrons TaxID=233779 RepID=UPI00234B0B33|nr:major facilitator superfamily domain-containing protein 6-like [Spea bombifrons]